MSKIKFLLFITLLTSSFLTGCSYSNTENETENRKNIDFIAKMSNGDYWDSVKLGANEAAKEFNVNLNFIGPMKETDVSEQLRELNQASNGKSDGIILAPADYKALSEVTSKIFDKKIPIIIVDSAISTNKITGYIASDNKAAGQKLGEKLIDLVGKESTVGIINFVKGAKNAEEREAGAVSTFSKFPDVKIAAIEYCMSDKKLAYELTKKMISSHNKLNGIIALSAIASDGAAEAIDDMHLKEKIKLVTFDNSIEEISYIENGVIEASLVQQQFNMGYLAVKYAAMSARGEKIPKKFITNSIIIDKSSLYLPQYEKIIFPFINES
ncbi:MAG: substrate-binding domain-containing protein [Bacillota bacterium]|nr:substrate-binding domain-containing protein [Bacillota bacterium]